MKYRWIRAAIVVMGAALIPGARAVAQASQPCMASTPRLLALVNWTTKAATGTDTLAANARSMSHIPVTSSANISVVTDSATCQHAADAYTAEVHDSASARRVFVVRADTVYVAVDPDFVFSGEWGMKMVLGSTFTVLARLTY